MGHMTAKVAVAKAIYAIDRPYDYRVPQELEGRLRPGMRVLVPFGAGNRGSDGIVLALSREGPEGGLKDVIAALDDQPVLDEKLLKLALWMRERYFCTVYDGVKAMLPAGLYYALRDCVALRSGWTGRRPSRRPGSPKPPRSWRSCCWPGADGATWSRSAPPLGPRTRTAPSGR